ncbi:MAG TPA: alpha/beta fold hydrolase [Solirubrobacteraceae bacterium]|jgi:hypothetical protein
MSEARIFRGATLVALLHALDDAFVSRQPGVGIGEHAVAGVLTVAVAAAGIAAFGRLRPGWRAALALTFGVAALANGVQHAVHAAVDGLGRADVTGVLAALAGVALVGLAVAIPLRHPAGEHRWRNRALGTIGALLLAYWVLMPLGGAIVQTHKFREPIGDPPSAAYAPVRFAAADGLELAGWYVASRNGAAVVIVHGGGGDRLGARRHARLLARHGYGVLLYDARGRGESEGSPNAFGWDWPKDVEGALAFLRSRRDVDDGRIGAIGLSTGADVLIQVAARDKAIAALVADGATARSTADIDFTPDTAYFWPLIAAVRVFSGSSPGPPLRELVARVSPTPLLLISSRRFPSERDFNAEYARSAREPSEWWDADVDHVGALRQQPAEYERRVIGLFDRTLLGRR